MLTPEQQQQFIDSAAKQGFSPEQINAYIQRQSSSVAAPQNASVGDAAKAVGGAVKSIAKGIANPFMRLGVTGYKALSTGKDVLDYGIAAIGGDEQAKQEALRKANEKVKSKTVNVPGYGDVNALGNDGSVRDMVDAAGVGAEMASNFIGGSGAASTVKSGVRGTIWNGIKTGVKMEGASGAVYGAGTGMQEPDANLMSVLERAGYGFVTGAGVGGPFGGITAAAGKAVEGVKSLVKLKPEAGQTVYTNPMVTSLQEKLHGIDPALKKALTSGDDALTKVTPDITPVTLDDLATVKPDVKPMTKMSKVDKMTKYNKYQEIADASVNDFSQPTALETAGNEAAKALKLLENQKNKWGQVKGEILKSVGDKQLQGLKSFQDEFSQLIDDRLNMSFQTVVDEVTGKPKSGLFATPGKISKLSNSSSDVKLLKDAAQVLHELGDTNSLANIDAAVDRLQSLVYEKSDNMLVKRSTSAEGIVKKLASKLDKMVKDSTPKQYAEANAKYRELMDISDELNKRLGERGKHGGSLMKSVFSPADRNTKKMFEKIKGLTGMNLVEDAELAKLAMQISGDERSMSLLEKEFGVQIERILNRTDFGKGGVAGDLINAGINKGIQTFKGDKRDQIRRLIQMGMDEAKKSNPGL